MSREALTNWEAFVGDVARLFDQGERDIEISKKFSGASVKWEGRVVDIKVDEKFAPGIALSMTPEKYPLSAGKTLRSDYLFLIINPKEKFAWRNCRVGDKVEFSAKISKSFGPFTEIRLSEYDDDPEVLLMVGLHEPVLVANL